MKRAVDRYGETLDYFLHERSTRRGVVAVDVGSQLVGVQVHNGLRHERLPE
jgi:hypothetical protein